MTRIAIVGCGYWGVNYVRVFHDLPGVEVAWVADASPIRLQTMARRYPATRGTTHWEDCLADPSVQALVFATPAASHFEMTRSSLAAGKDVLVEKPLTTRPEEADELVRLARETGRILMVGHTFLYNPAVRQLKRLMSDSRFGRLHYLHSTRTNMGPIRSDVNSVWDLAPHDVAIFGYLVGAPPTRVSAVGAAVLGNSRADVGFITLTYPGGVIANIHVSWVDPNKVREVVAVGSQRRIVFDDTQTLERIRVFEKGVESSMPETGSYGEFRLSVRDGDIISPKVDSGEPLVLLAQEFVDSVQTRRSPQADGANGADVVRVMAAVDRSMSTSGAPVELP